MGQRTTLAQEGINENPTLVRRAASLWGGYTLVDWQSFEAGIEKLGYFVINSTKKSVIGGVSLGIDRLQAPYLKSDDQLMLGLYSELVRIQPEENLRSVLQKIKQLILSNRLVRTEQVSERETIKRLKKIGSSVIHANNHDYYLTSVAQINEILSGLTCVEAAMLVCGLVEKYYADLGIPCEVRVLRDTLLNANNLSHAWAYIHVRNQEPLIADITFSEYIGSTWGAPYPEMNYIPERSRENLRAMDATWLAEPANDGEKLQNLRSGLIRLIFQSKKTEIDQVAHLLPSPVSNILIEAYDLYWELPDEYDQEKLDAFSDKVNRLMSDIDAMSTRELLGIYQHIRENIFTTDF